MISLVATENKLKAVIEELLVPPLSQPAFALVIHPGDLDDRAVNARQVSNVLVRFDSIDYEAAAFARNCFSQTNTVKFKILVNNNSLRSHQDVYAIAEAIIGKLRGNSELLIAADGNAAAQTSAEISSFSFLSFDGNKACNKSEITIQIKYVDHYGNNKG